jgi:hypothetical protein
MDQKTIELANLYGIEISDTPGCKIVENGVERLATEKDVDKIFGFEISQESQDNFAPAKGIINGIWIGLLIWGIIGLMIWLIIR